MTVLAESETEAVVDAKAQNSPMAGGPLGVLYAAYIHGKRADGQAEIHAVGVVDTVGERV